MKKIMIALFLISIAVSPAHAAADQHPIKNFMKKVTRFFRESPFAIQRKQIQKAYDEDKMSKDEYEDRMADVDRQEQVAEERKQQLIEQRKMVNG